MGDTGESEDAEDLDQRIRPEAWTIEVVRGREAGEREPGLPRLSEITLMNEAGDRRTYRARPTLRGGDPGTGVAVPIACAPVVPIRVSRCLICFTTDGPWADEHLPPQNFGGTVLLVTCADCNNKLGSLEGALLEWYDRRHRWRVRIPEQQQPISAGWVTLLTSDDGEMLVINDETWTADEQRDVFTEHAGQGGPFIPEGAPPQPAAYLNAALKQAYLAGCILLGGIPAVPSADEIRAELVAARDAGRRLAELGPRAAAVGLRAVEMPEAQPPLSLYQGDREGRPDFLICLAGTLLLDWPFPELDPRSWQGRHRRVGA